MSAELEDCSCKTRCKLRHLFIKTDALSEADIKVFFLFLRFDPYRNSLIKHFCLTN